MEVWTDALLLLVSLFALALLRLSFSLSAQRINQHLLFSLPP